MKSQNQLPKALKNAKKSKWQDNAKWRQENRAWLTRSFQIASHAYAKLKRDGNTQQWLAEQMDCSAQYVGKILKGKENLTLQTIAKLESVLGLQLIDCTCFEEFEVYEQPVEQHYLSFSEFQAEYTGEFTPTSEELVVAGESNYGMAA